MLKQQLQFMNRLFNILSALSCWLVVASDAFHNAAFKKTQLVRFDELHRLYRAVFVMSTADLNGK